MARTAMGYPAAPKPAITEVAAIDPVASMQAIDNSGLKEVAGQVAAKLKSMVDGL